MTFFLVQNSNVALIWEQTQIFEHHNGFLYKTKIRYLLLVLDPLSLLIIDALRSSSSQFVLKG